MSNISCILYPPSLNYDYLIQRPQQLMKSFSEQNITCYYLNHTENAIPKEVRQINPHFFVLNNINPRTYLLDTKPVVYFTIPQHIDVVPQYNPALLVFDSLDEPTEEFAPWKNHYDKAVKQSDIVITTSDKLYNMAKPINPNTYLVPNGCDYSHFSQAANKNLPIPQDIQNIPDPIIGYIGAVASWVDMELIQRVALAYPNYHIVIIGPLFNINESQIPKLPNIHWLGHKPYQELPNYAQMFNVGIIPFRSSEMIGSVNPIKMWEYLATGMPVVTSSIPEIRKYEPYVYYSENDNHFITNIEIAINNQSEEAKRQRMALAQRNSWTVRGKQIIQIIEEHLMRTDPNAKRPNTNFFRVGNFSSPYFSAGAPIGRQLNISRKGSIRFAARNDLNISIGTKVTVNKGKAGFKSTNYSIGSGTGFRLKTARAIRM